MSTTITALDLEPLLRIEADPNPNAWSDRLQDLQRIRGLEDDWDGEGTNAPEPAMVDWAWMLAERLRDSGSLPPDRMHVGVNATIYFEWYTPAGYREVEVLNGVDAEERFIPKGTLETEVVVHSRRA